jgi:hypothetical protein
MPLNILITTRGLELDPESERRVYHQLERVERRLVKRPAPRAELVLTRRKDPRTVDVDLRIVLAPMGAHLVSHRSAETIDKAVRLAAEDVERELERRGSAQQGEDTYGVPSRRLPKHLRPHPPR